MAETSTGGPHAQGATIERYVLGDLPRAAGRKLERHLAGCVTCQAAVAAAGDARESTVRWRGHRFAPAELARGSGAPGDDRL
ncbi:MAG TPA: hypothetical protein VIH93_16990, partial [Thermoanaerobaculia bacterium]